MRITFHRPTSLGIICCILLLFTKIKSQVAYDTVGNSSLIIDLKDEIVTDIIPNIFVLNLDRSQHRWRTIQEVMKNANLIVERLSGIDGRSLSSKDLKLNSTIIASYLQPRGVLGCYLSHRKFWQIVVDRGYDSAIIFEDDVVLIPDFKDTLRTSLTRLKQDNFDYDLVFLGALGMVHPDGRHTLFSKLFSAYIGGAQKYVPINDYLYRPSRPAVRTCIEPQGYFAEMDIC